jgi:TnpA family transposase
VLPLPISPLVAQKYEKIKSWMLAVKAFGKIIKSLFILHYIDESLRWFEIL